MKDLFKTKTFVAGVLSIATGIFLVVKSPENRETGIAMITAGVGMVTLRDAIRKGK